MAAGSIGHSQREMQMQPPLAIGQASCHSIDSSFAHLQGRNVLLVDLVCCALACASQE